ncbi:putative DCC family thiol-disulfide oxidoreductase YuxK [Scopulibacillus daqui]|uniref:DCC family thiol-disulfide oxidoreductase YuxK n=1 Tax=Scopulibacillus daqui TaxID=1469162 RepID=A0ABS2PV23_9BACL|nr:DUF393 domain-containing protein [Scopulibacillus daqui]MBM7643902.1 putative DCC family thiol-disulfide oxidoreductase YuxK [Scopulibacillus daqui]
MSQRLLVFYDGDCRLCTAAMRMLKKRDKKKRIAWMSFRNPMVMKAYRLKDKHPEERIYAIDTKKRRDFTGIYTVREIAKQIPAYWIAVPFIQIAIFLGVGHQLYDFIAKRRHLFPVGKCKDDHCRIS